MGCTAGNFYPRPPRGGRPDAQVCSLSAGPISIHVLREEDDVCRCIFHHGARHFYPRPPRGGRPQSGERTAVDPGTFLSTSSARRTTETIRKRVDRWIISIHVLREEDDGSSVIAVQRFTNFYPRPPRGGRQRADTALDVRQNFYPRPPRGGRRQCVVPRWVYSPFLSTSSARRTTISKDPVDSHHNNFYPRPPRGGRRLEQVKRIGGGGISIHVLREEDDRP